MSGSGWFLRLPPPTASADEAVPTRPSPEQPCRDSPLQRSGLLERPRWGSSASSLRAPAPPGPAAPRSGRPRATAAGRPGPRPLPGPRARGQAAVGGGAAPERASEAPPRQLGPRARRGRARAHGGLPAPLRARPAGGQRGGPSPPALRGDAAEARRPGSRPADAAFPAAPSAPLSQSRAWPAARNRVAELCARSGVGVDGGKPGRPPRARLCARSRALFARSLRLLSTGHETRFQVGAWLVLSLSPHLLCLCWLSYSTL